jgi:hypothetical protein
MTRPRLTSRDVSRAHPGGDAHFRHRRLSRMAPDSWRDELLAAPTSAAVRDTEEVPYAPIAARQ